MREAFSVLVVDELLENLDDLLYVRFFVITVGPKSKADRFLGEMVIKWKQCLIRPDEYAINWEQTLQNVSFAKKKDDEPPEGPEGPDGSEGPDGPEGSECPQGSRGPGCPE